MVKNFKLNYGNYTKFDGDLTIRGLPYYGNTYLNFNAKQISTNYYDLIKLPNYPFTENKTLDLPSQLKPLGTVTYKGNFDGFLNDFTSLSTINTAIGKVNVDVAISSLQSWIKRSSKFASSMTHCMMYFLRML